MSDKVDAFSHEVVRPERALAGRSSTIRKARQADVDQVAEIEAESYQAPWPAGFFARCLDAGYEFWVLSEGERIHGYFVVGYLGGIAHLMNLCIRSGQRRRGLGKKLLGFLIALARERECGLFLEVRSSNRAARQLYHSTGLRVMGRRRGYYDSPEGFEDAIVMALPCSELS